MKEGEKKRVWPMSGHPVWENGESEYPDVLLVTMKDGEKIRYRREVEQPGPLLITEEEIQRIIRISTFGGYKFKGERRKKK